MMTHALGEAGAPFLVGLLVDSRTRQVRRREVLDSFDGFLLQLKTVHTDYCQEMIDYLAIQQSLYLPMSLLCLGGLLFLLATKWVVRDEAAVSAGDPESEETR